MTFQRQLLAASAAAGALAFASPSIAQEMTYEYAQPATATPPVVYTTDPVVQPLPTEQAPSLPPAPPMHVAPPADWQNGHRHAEGSPWAEPMPTPAPYSEYAAPMGGYPQMAYPGPVGAPTYGYGAQMPAPAPRFDRDAWLDNCQDRLRGVKEKDRAGVIGGLLGAVAGGVAGNRIAGAGERLAGSLIGAGVGGLAGIAIGSAIGASNNHKRRAECEAYLDRYTAGYPQRGDYAYGYPAYGYGYGYTMVPMMVAVPQRRVVHETVTEEWVDVPATAVRTRRIDRPARRSIPAQRPTGDKRIKYTKTN